MNNVFEHVDPNKVNTGLLKEYGVRYMNIEMLDGSLSTDNVLDMRYYRKLYSSLYSMHIGSQLSGMDEPGSLFDLMSQLKGQHEGKVLISVLYYDYNAYKSNALSISNLN
ncbi:hypothetical protein [Reichenbachiella ulvae]|uniref:Uncharacterized protein n=1 Tax=Reichenbachiella ulvae TaxID=2980104 RepID=A0ABT3CX65_9BACT|nr:hypothetical protein [Reichenbachiella ulvae]MCV9388134.1 hypothetical protein [Reichenbachiella ulvae]